MPLAKGALLGLLLNLSHLGWICEESFWALRKSSF